MAAEQIDIRDARPGERPAIADLTMAAYAEHARTMEPTAWALLERVLRNTLASDPPGEWIVAERAGALAGSVLLSPPVAGAYGGEVEQIDWPEVRLLAVEPALRGQGVGQALMDECVARARAAGYRTLGLHSSASLRAALRMYERMGFVRAPAYDFQPPGAELVMAFRLDLER